LNKNGFKRSEFGFDTNKTNPFLSISLLSADLFLYLTPILVMLNVNLYWYLWSCTNINAKTPT